MQRYFFKSVFFYLFASLLIPAAPVFAKGIACPPNCDQPSADTQAHNNDVITRIYALIDKQAVISKEISQYPRGAPPELMAEMQNIESQIQYLSTQMH